jgi:hypothetical protein
MYTIGKIKVSREKQKNSGEKSILSFLLIIDKFAESKILLIMDDAFSVTRKQGRQRHSFLV